LICHININSKSIKKIKFNALKNIKKYINCDINNDITNFLKLCLEENYSNSRILINKKKKLIGRIIKNMCIRHGTSIKKLVMINKYMPHCYIYYCTLLLLLYFLLSFMLLLPNYIN